MTTSDWENLGIVGFILVIILGGGYALLNQNTGSAPTGAVKPCGGCGGTQKWLQG